MAITTCRIQALALLICGVFAAAASGDINLLRTSKGSKEPSPHKKNRDSKKLNVYGKELQLCSSKGMALTGFTRTGHCVEKHDDKGSHHICIDLSSTSHSGKNFCGVTGQEDWCDDQMPCSDESDEKCPVQHWCVCQWAFAKYIEEAGGCDAIQTIDCNATNLEALKAYEKKAKEGVTDQFSNALNCLKQRCNLDVDVDVAIA
jgi:uncharacterized protein (DUF2237 family)